MGATMARRRMKEKNRLKKVAASPKAAIKEETPKVSPPVSDKGKRKGA